MKPKRNPDIETKLLPDGHVVIFSNTSEWAHTITPLAAVAWEFCDGEHSVDEILSLVMEYAGDSDNISILKPELTDLLTDFVQSGFVSDAALCSNV